MGYQWEKRLTAAFFIAAELAGLPGCGSAGEALPSVAMAPEAGLKVEEALPEAAEPEWTGEGLFADAGELTAPQQEAVLRFMDFYYNSLAGLSVQEDSGVFSTGAGVQRSGNLAVLRYIIAVRSMQRTDLSLAAYRYQLTCLSAQEREDGQVEAMVREYSVQNFSAHPQVDSEQLGVYHRFVLAPEGDGAWRVQGHAQMDSLFWMVMGRDAFGAGQAEEGFPIQDGGAPLSFPQGDREGRLQELIEQAEDNTAGRLSQGTAEEKEAQHPYNRAAAVSYAGQWAGLRNEQWPDYSRYGGNCQNFTSQCLLAGGIPMDIQGPQVWKWYGTAPDNGPRAAGRSASWSSVGDFLSYARGNEGYGLSASADAPYYTGEPGDILHMGTEEDWRHTVIITGVVRDESGQTVDYLVASNTAELKNFPAGAYAYTRQMLIKIWGWNE